MTRNAPYILIAPSSRRIMWTVAAALLPGIVALVILEGTRWLGNLAIAAIAATASEALILKIRAKPHIFTTASDGSALLTALLLALALPAATPAWLIAFAAAFAIVFGKQLYGGLGMNPFNPAMLGFAFALISFPALTSQHFGEPLPLSTLWQNPDTIDALSGVTTLDPVLNSQNAGEYRAAGIETPQFILQLCWLAGGIFLLIKRYIDWRIPTAVLLGIGLTGFLFGHYDPTKYLDPLVHLLAGASILGAFFIATDPVTAATTPRGRWIYGLLIGILTVCIRELGSYPDGVAFAVLLANATVPLLDPLTQPRYR
ncbi:MAG: RnfABCDGE type electron transport complex subunit D [Cardiobacteriaceae bacterium]|nr:RnfABCDGE type electron transport complex subunit D [Cardiobacteriaceae bacterium]